MGKSRNVKYTRSCFICKQDHEAYTWYSTTRGFFCKQHAQSYITKAEESALSWKVKAEELKKDLSGKETEIKRLTNSVMLKSQEVEELEETISHLQKRIEKLQDY